MSKYVEQCRMMSKRVERKLEQKHEKILSQNKEIVKIEVWKWWGALKRKNNSGGDYFTKGTLK